MVGRRLFCLVVLVVLACCAVAAAQQKILYQKQSPYNTVVVAEDDQGMRTLLFGSEGVRQSVVKVGDPDHLELPYARAMVSGLALCPEPKRVLVVGLGGGTIPSFLHKHYPQTRIDAVEIDPVVVEVAKQFFGFREDATQKAYVQDGRQFIEERLNVYDVIFLDAFGSENIPYHLATREFLEAVRRAVEGTEKPVYQQGRLVGHVQEYSDTLLIFLLKGRRPEKYGEKLRQEISGPGGDAVQIDDRGASAARIAAILEAAQGRPL